MTKINTDLIQEDLDNLSGIFDNKLNGKLNKGTILYDNSNGTNGNIVLSDDSSNYAYLIVYWKSSWNSTRQGCAIAPPSSYKWALSEVVVGAGSDNATYTNIAIYYIGGTQFDLDKAKNYNGQNNNTFYITKIVGYN